MTKEQLRHEKRLVERRKVQVKNLCDGDWKLDAKNVQQTLTLAQAVEYIELAEKHGMWV